MRVGVLTFANTLNFGAALQAYALVRALGALGCDAEVIDYDCPAVTRREHPRLTDPELWRPKALARYALERAALREKEAAFCAFDEQYVPRSPQQYTPADIADARSRYDIFVSGSDQIWNLNLTGDDFSFFLEFEPDPARKIAYAASLGSEQGTGRHRERMAAALSEYGEVGVRERSGKEIVERLTGRSDVAVTVDPVLLLSRTEWNRLLQPVETTRRPYLLLYFLHDRSGALHLARRLAAERSLEIVYVTERPHLSGDLQTVRGAGPREFVSLIRGAEMVVTGSFHATVFATALNRPFVCDTPRGGFSRRIDDFLTTTGLTDRAGADGESTCSWDQDWDSVNAILARERELSLEFLRASLAKSGFCACVDG